MRRRWLTFVGCILASWVFIYLLCSYYDQDPLGSTPDIALIYNWIVHRHDYQLLVQSVNTTPQIQPPSVCHGEPLLVIIVCSSVTNFIPRKAIRETWGKDTDSLGNTQVYFLVGSANNTATKRTLESENLVHNDIIQYDFVENYHNLTLKSVLLLKWTLSYCQKARYVMKVDDDVFIHMSNIVRHLLTHPNPRVMMGVRVNGARPVKNTDSKWYMPLAEYSKLVYPDYLAGPGYIMGKYAVQMLYRNSFRKPFIRMEDVYITGICSEGTGLHLEGHEGFSYTKIRNDPCLFRTMFATHRMTPDELYYMWGKVYNPSLICYWWSGWIYWR